MPAQPANGNVQPRATGIHGIAAWQHSAAVQAHRVHVQHAIAARCIEPTASSAHQRTPGSAHFASAVSSR